MKVSRIVDHTFTDESLADADNEYTLSRILQKRIPFYEKYFDIRIWPKQGVTIEELQTETKDAVIRHIEQKRKSYTSTRMEKDDGNKTWNFNEVLLSGMVPNAYGGGLFIRNTALPYLDLDIIQRLSTLSSYQERAKIILEKLISFEDITPQRLSVMISDAYSSFQSPLNVVVPVHRLDHKMFIEELFHGPTGSFKDLALQLLPRMIGSAMLPNQRTLYIVATSGDTGSAVLEGFGRIKEYKDQLALFVMYPDNGISTIQKQQMVSFDGGKNVTVVGIKGNFDDCQNMVKSLFANDKFLQKIKTRFNVTLNTANSINYGRILPQIVYHINSYCNLLQQYQIEVGELVDICIPTGNFGNILSAIFAKQMGIPFDNIICASNDNKILNDFFEKGLYDLRDRLLKRTISPAIDILVSSNLERYLWLCLGGQRTSNLYHELAVNRYFEVTNKELTKIKNVANIRHGWCTEEACKNTIERYKERCDYFLDPHTAVAVNVADRYLLGNKDKPVHPMLIASTAHCSKFLPPSAHTHPTTYPADHIAIKNCFHKPIVHSIILESNLDQVIQYMEVFLANCFYILYKK